MFTPQERSTPGCVSLPQTSDTVSKGAPIEAPWQVLHVRSNFEKRVAQHLMVRSVEYYVPLYTERVKWTDRFVVTERPLFTGYVFVRFGHESRIAVISTPGVVRCLGADERSLVSSAELNRIREGISSGLLLRPHPNLTVGERVRVRRGIFEGVEGVVTEFRQQCNVVISMGAVQQCFSLEMDSADIEVVKNSLAKVPSPSRTRLEGWRLQCAEL